MNSTVDIHNNNTFTGGDDLDGLVAFTNTAIKLRGSGNVINAGNQVGPEQPNALVLGLNSTFYQHFVTPGSGNQINGDIELWQSSTMLLFRVAMNSVNFTIWDSSVVELEPSLPGDIVLNVSNVEVFHSSKFGMGGNGAAVNINSGGVTGIMRVQDSSFVGLDGGSVSKLNVQLHRGSSMTGIENSTIDGNLEVHGFSTYRMEDLAVSPSVSGTVTCTKGEAIDFTTAVPGTEIPLGSCL